jgi:Carboxypeptidase regulatory-like domain
MKRRGFFGCGLAMVFLITVSSAFCAEIAGTVADPQGHPVSGVKITVQEPAGKVVGQGIADAAGHYSIDGLAPNTYDFFLDPLTTGVKGGSGVSYLDANGLTIDWKVSDAKNALATPGSKQKVAGDPFGMSMEEFVSVTVLATAVVAGGVVGGYGAAGGFGEGHSSSSSM